MCKIIDYSHYKDIESTNAPTKGCRRATKRIPMRDYTRMNP